MRVSAFIATSVDGYIAKKDGGIEWLNEISATVGDEDLGYERFISDVDCMVMGRNTYDVVKNFTPWPYAGKRIYVISRHLSVLDVAHEGVTLFNGSIHVLGQELRGSGYKKVYVDGGKTIQSFLNEGLLSDICITIVPIILGDGIALIEGVEQMHKLTLTKSEAFKCGFVQSTYGVNL